MSRKIFLSLAVCLLPSCADPGLEPAPSTSRVGAAVVVNEDTKLLASDGQADDLFGGAVAISGDTAVATNFDDRAGADSGFAYVYVRSGTTWSEQQKIGPRDAEAGDEFGTSVALEGDTLVVGSRFEDDAASNAGAVYVFDRTGDTWTETAKLTASDGAENDELGRAVALFGDTIVAGAYSVDGPALGDAGVQRNVGAAYVFVRTGGVWTEQAKLTASDGAAFDVFGEAVDVNADTAIVGATGHDGGTDGGGAAYVFVRTGDVWSEQAKLLGSDDIGDAGRGDQFGHAVGVEGDISVIGARFDDGLAENAGAVHAFVRTGTSWNEEAKLVASDGVVKDELGFAVSIDGNRALVGAVGANPNGSDSGEAYVYVREASGWIETSQLITTDGEVQDFLGGSVAIDERFAIVGAFGDDDQGSEAGAAYVFGLACQVADDCPAGTECVAGECVRASDAGAESGGGGGGGVAGAAGAAGASAAGGQAGGAGVSGAGGDRPTAGTGGQLADSGASPTPPGSDPGSDGGCGCRASGSRSLGSTWLLLAALLLVRRRRRSLAYRP